AAKDPASGLVSAPGMAHQVAAYDHFNTEGLAAAPDRHIGGGNSLKPIRTYIACCFQHMGRNLVQYLAFKGYGAGEDDIEGGNPVGGEHYQPVADAVHIPDLAP